MDGDWLNGLTRQTQELDFSELVQRSYQVKKEDSAEENGQVKSLAGNADKSDVLAMLDALEEEELKEQALAVSHSENVSEWIDAIAAVMEVGKAQRLVDITKKLKMPLVTVWLAALLGGFRLEQCGGFYATREVWISTRIEDGVTCSKS